MTNHDENDQILLQLADKHVSERTNLLCKEIARSTYNNKNDYDILKQELRGLARSIFADMIKYLDSLPR